MDRGLKPEPRTQKGGAFRALPFFALGLCLLGAFAPALRADVSDNAPLSNTPAPASNLGGDLDAGVRLLYSNPAELNAGLAAAGFPKTGGLWLLWGGGATITPNPLRIQMSAWKGSLSGSAEGSATDWNLALAALTLEQAYPVADFLFLGGVSLEGGELDGSLIRGGALSGVSSELFGYSVQAGLRWPAQTPLAFCFKAGWELLYGPGAWHGPANLGNSLFELGGPTATLQVELSL